jgi:hypothetical protein
MSNKFGFNFEEKVYTILELSCIIPIFQYQFSKKITSYSYTNLILFPFFGI